MADLTPIELIHYFNSKAGLLEKPYNDKLESSFQIEEALEGLSDLQVLASTFGTVNSDPKHLSRIIVGLAHNDGFNLPDVERFDKALDAIVFAFGSIYKLGLTPEQALRGLSAVMQANLAKLDMPKDAQGKLMKPDNFVGPEATLQKILEER